MIKWQLVPIVFALSLVACDVATDRYATLQDARADSLFQRGWLPDILPPSSHSIHTSNDLDLNLSSGEFHFSSSEFSEFSAALHFYTGRKSPLRNLDDEVSRLARQGYKPFEFTTADTVWVFLCHAEQGVCEYRMWAHAASDV